MLDELGVEPGPALRELQAAILRQDPELAPAPSAWPRPLRSSRRRIALLAVGGALLAGARRGGGAAREQRPREGPGRARGERRGRDRPRRRRGDRCGRRRPLALSPRGRRADALGHQRRWTQRLARRPRRPARSAKQSPSGAAPPGWRSPPARCGWPTAATAPCRGSTRSTNTVVQRIPVGTNPTGVAAGAGAVWVANSGEQTISRIDPGSGRATTIDVHAEPTELAVGAGAVWMTSSSNRIVSQLDPRSGRVVDVIDGGRRSERDRGRPRRRLGRQHTRWHRLADRPGDRRDRDVPVGNGPNAIAVGPRRRVGQRAVRRRRRSHRPARRNRVVQRSVGNRPTGLALAGGKLWVGPAPRAPRIAAGRAGPRLARSTRSTPRLPTAAPRSRSSQ